ncbi:hypothetical protein FKP32DRAFT_1616036 [Trametes sanguinea]|nr:hypothetical protein FKP32DRAFT_1616036 [Trametes sanguinea]
MKTWIPKRDLYLDELVRREGRGSFTNTTCGECHSSLPDERLIRCTTCSPGPLRCAQCVVNSHVNTPFHRVQRWTGHSFESATLKELGQVIQLGHRHDGRPCSNPLPVRSDFHVLHIDGRHNVALAFCGCDNASRAGDHVQQLLRFDLYPATECEPNTVFTMALLEHYHIQSLQGKISMYDYYTTLERMTDNTGTTKMRDRYKAFMRVVAQFRHLKMLQRGGRAHDPSGVEGTKPGELAVRCPACPHPGINLPPNWESVSDDLKFLYWISVAIDACFRLKRRAISSVHKNPILGSGWAYFTEDSVYKDILSGYKQEDEISSCTGFAALDHANTKFSRGYDATGVGAVICARHEFWLAQGVGDLQKGERYVNMDYVFVSAMREYLIVNKVVSYDIACQWSKHLLERIANFPSHIQLNIPEGSITYVIPKLHFRSHIQQNHSPYSLNYRRGCARNDGEGIERRWWDIQPIASSTKVMGPGQRQGVLEDHWGYSNWRKLVDLPWTLRDRLKNALVAFQTQADQFNNLTMSLKAENIAQWTKQVEGWERNPWEVDDPYITVSSGLTEAETVEKLTEEERRASAVPGYIALHDVSPLGFVKMGLELEETRVSLKADARAATSSKKLAIHERRNALRRKLQKYRELQGVYMPLSVPLFANDPDCCTDTESIEDVRVGLPSEIAPTHRSAVCPSRLSDMEAHLREAQCRDALRDLRNKLHVIDHLYRYKQTNVRHQGPNTRVRADLASQDAKKDRAAEKYRRARRAKLALSGPGPWELELRVLQDADIRAIEDDDPEEVERRKRKRGDKGATSEGHRTLSWIWRGADSDNPHAVTDSIRVEWLKARARKMRWEEECALLPEEMRRVLATLKYEEEAWLKRRTARRSADSSLQEGLVAFAEKQARMRHRMRATFVAICRPLATGAKAKLGEEWEALPVAEGFDADDMDSRDFMTMYEVDGEDFEYTAA